MTRARETFKTVEDLYAMPDDGYRYELQGGLLLCEPLPGFRHGRITANLVALLVAHADHGGLGAVVTNDTGFLLATNPDTVRGPDIAFVSRERVERVGEPRLAFPEAPDLVVEVLSPSNRPADIHAKVADYLAAGTRLVWVVDPDSASVAVYRALLSPRTLREPDVLDGGEVLPGFRVPVADLFVG